MRIFNKYTFSILALFLISPVFSEIPVLWRWAEVNTNQKFLSDQTSDKSGSQTNMINRQSEVQIWGRPGCGYTKRLLKSLEDWKFPYVYHDINLPMTQYDAEAMRETVRKSGITGQYNLPVVRVGDTPIVGNPTDMDDVVKALADQGKLPLQYIPSRIGSRMVGILALEVILVVYIWLATVLFKIVRGFFSSSGKGM